MSRLLLFKVIQRCLNTTWNLDALNAHRDKLRMSILSLSSLSHDSTECRTRLALPVDYDRVMDFMHKTYYKSEPTLVNIGLSCSAEPPSELTHLMREHIKEGMTIIAETSDNCVVGTAVNVGSCPWDPENMIQYADCCCERGPIRDVIKFFAHVTSQPKLWNKYCVLKIFECSYLSVDAQYCGLGIGKRLVRESWQLARDCGYQVFRIDCTSNYTTKIAEGFGWECVFTIPYRRYINNGDFVFKHIQEPHTEVRVYVDQPFIGKNASHDK